MSNQVTEEIRQKILKYLRTVNKARNRDVARATGVEKDLIDKAIGELAKEGKVEYRTYGGISYVGLKGKITDE